MNKKLKTELVSQFRMKRIGKPKDTTKLIGFLASENAEWITGQQVIHSEGGLKGE
jgi:3-oxoacyl-[acyl-carrier protein] reductase